MDVGAQRVGREVLLPQARGEVGDAASGMLTDPLQNIDQIGVRINAVESAGDDQNLDDADVFRAEFGPAKKPCFATRRHCAQRSLQMIRIDGDIRVGEEYFETDTPRAHIVQRLDKRVAWREALALELSIDPFEEELDERFAVRQAMQLLGFSDELAIADFVLDGIQRLDLFNASAAPVGSAANASKKPLREWAPHRAWLIPVFSAYCA